MSTVRVYMDTGVVHTYDVSDPMKGREHAAAIVKTGYRHTPKNSKDMEWFPPARVEKVVVEGGAESTRYRDTSEAT